MSGALDGIRVVDLTRVLAGPLCTQQLGDLGADVIKVEQPGKGDDTRAWGPPFAGGESAYYLGVNRNKRSVTLNLKTDEGRDILRKLIAGADVVVDNFRLGTMEGWGFDDDWYERHVPRVVRCTISGYGRSGPKAGMPGYDFILQAESGLMAITGEPGRESMKLGVAIVDICTGLMATISILAALEARATTGRGQRADVNLHDTGLQLLANVASNHLISGEPAARYGNGHPNIVPYRTFPAADGELAVAVGNDRQFARLAALLGHPEWAQDARFARNRDRVEHRDEIDQLIAEILVDETRQHWIRLLDEAGIPCGPINQVAEALASPQARARDMVVAVEHPTAGAYSMVGLPLRLTETPAQIARAAPLLGEHTDEVLGELGVDEATVSALRDAGVI